MAPVLRRHVCWMSGQEQKESDRCGTRTHSLSLRRAARYHCANRPGLKTNYEDADGGSIYIAVDCSISRYFHHSSTLARVCCHEWGVCCSIARRMQPAAGSIMCGGAECCWFFSTRLWSDRVRSKAVVMLMISRTGESEKRANGDKEAYKLRGGEVEGHSCDMRWLLAPRRPAFEPQLPSAQRSCLQHLARPGSRSCLQAQTLLLEAIVTIMTRQ